jgi:hypothetical protein
MLEQRIMSEYLHERSGPLVSLTPEESAEKMISEGGPLGQPHGTPLHDRSTWDDAMETLDRQFHDTVVKHPLPSLLIAFGLGLLVGGIFHRD